MKFGLDIPTTGNYADARVLTRLATEAEAAGWDGFFLWDVLLGDQPSIDPWIALTAIALQTSRIKIGLLVLPLARHRPWLVARQLANLDQLSQGRVICTVGIGHQERDFSAFGENADPLVRAKQLDEGLQVLTGLWCEDNFSFAGAHYNLDQVTLHSRPVQPPRIPIWIVGGWPRRPPFRRAAQWDGVCLKSVHAETGKWLTLDEFRTSVAYVYAHRTSTAPFDVAIGGETPDDHQQAIAKIRSLQDAGATWWLEEPYGWSFEEFCGRIRKGPPHE
jgi:alkanesulfonate monooxygenase SsuD/methylene tetrahydromethanopterin reductase-like flavin-dependent oxidoreductase (luciferase family)